MNQMEGKHLAPQYSPGIPLHSPGLGSPGEADPFIHGEHQIHYPTKLYEESSGLKKLIRVLRFIARLATTAIAAGTAQQEARTLRDFLTTKNTVRDGRGPWAATTSLWPAVMLLAVSGISLISGLMIMIAYAFSIRRANQISSIYSWFSYLVEAIHVITWIVVAVLYRVGKTGKDLWGWACSPIAQKIQPNFKDIVNFEAVCQRGSRSWILAIASASLQLLGLVIFIFAFRRWRLQKKLGKI